MSNPVARSASVDAPEATDPTTAAHILVDSILADWRGRIIEPMLDYVGYEQRANQISEAKMLAQLLMEYLIDLEGLSPQHKLMMVEMADHMGPDWAQGLYRAAVFVTKVA